MTFRGGDFGVNTSFINHNGIIKKLRLCYRTQLIQKTCIHIQCSKCYVALGSCNTGLSDGLEAQIPKQKIRVFVVRSVTEIIVQFL